MTKRIFLHKLHRHAFMSIRFTRSIIYTWERQKRVFEWVRILAFESSNSVKYTMNV